MWYEYILSDIYLVAVRWLILRSIWKTFVEKEKKEKREA